AIGAAGGLPFEPSTVTRVAGPALPPGATLKYPSLAEPNAGVRDSRTAITATPPAAAPVEKAALVPAPPAERAIAAPPAANPPGPPTPTAAAEGASTDKPSRARRHHGDSDKADPLHRKIDVPGDPATPAELKNPFAAP
ncbi:MAG TPA: hypothetical protein VLT58_12695, partial [Polyangia bacterium]|nr:hypothetical protein [Polyangia bacterium]